jgi:hypothetical protein
MIDATTHTRKIWRSHFDGADSTIFFIELLEKFPLLIRAKRRLKIKDNHLYRVFLKYVC